MTQNFVQKNDQKNVPKMTQKNEQKWGPKIDFFGDLSRILKKWYQIDSFPRVSLWPAGRAIYICDRTTFYKRTLRVQKKKINNNNTI